jgi:predicted nucleotidyltransferase
MRLLPEHAQRIRQIVTEMAGADVPVKLFGSRLDEHRRGGDVDLFIELPTPVAEPALFAAQLSARISRQLGSRHVDVVLAAPNLQAQAIHDIARREGVCL